MGERVKLPKKTEHMLEELRRIYAQGFTGQIVLHSAEGSVEKYELTQFRRPPCEERRLTAPGEGSR